MLNPVRADMVQCPEDWSCSSYQAMTGKVPAPSWLAIDGLLTQFSTQRKRTIERYTEFVRQGVDKDSIWKKLKGQIYLGDELFVSRMQEKIRGKDQDVNFPKAQRRPVALPLSEYQNSQASRNEAIVTAHESGAYSYQDIADFFGLHFTTAGKTVRAAKLKKQV